jgi:hypothetical protein
VRDDIVPRNGGISVKEFFERSKYERELNDAITSGTGPAAPLAPDRLMRVIFGSHLEVHLLTGHEELQEQEILFQLQEFSMSAIFHFKLGN